MNFLKSDKIDSLHFDSILNPTHCKLISVTWANDFGLSCLFIGCVCCKFTNVAV